MVHSKKDEEKGEESILEPIAIVGMSCRLPGGIDSPSGLWDLLKAKGSGQTPKVPANRFNIDAHYHKSLERPGSFNVLGGYFLDGALEDFDPTFFNITPIEAMWLDPQQRKMLEVSYECLESAGLSLNDVSGSNTAVFVGSFTSDYQQMSIRDTDFRHNYAATGVDPGIISNRIGNTFNLRGPSFTINTACSSSIYAIHNACNALRARDCEAAIAGGVNLILTVDQHMNTAKLGILSPTSTCHTFDASADGYGRAEGAGALYLKRLSDAIRDGDPVRGVIRSSFVNTNGKVEGMGITHPSVEGQGRVLRTAYKKANLNPNLTAYAEAHGTGTPVGDPIEVRAIANAMNDTRSPDKPLLVGAIKANIGHSEAASGIFAVMKGALMTEAGIIPGVAGFKTLNPNIREKEWNVKVNVDTTPWPADFPVRRASVSSFGYGGTNGHVIVESIESLYPWYEHGKPKSEATYNNQVSRPVIITLSAHDKTTLVRNIEAHARVAEKFYLVDLAYTLNSRRTKFPSIAYTIASEDQSGAIFAPESFNFGSRAKVRTELGFIFTGQGAQWAGVGIEAMKAFPIFLETIQALDRVLQHLAVPPSWKLEEVLLAPKATSRLSEPEIAQPICTAIQIAIVDLLAYWDISPVVSVGHSSGEIGAAYAAGLVSAPEAIIAAFYRGLAVKQAAPIGTMLAVGLGANDVAKYIADLSSEVVIACENSPSSVTLSGTFEGIGAVKQRLDAESIFARELQTGKAYHSPQMEPVAQLYEKLLLLAYRTLDQNALSWRQPRSRFISSVTGGEHTGEYIPHHYWSENLRNRVLFDTAVTTLGNHPDLSQVSSMIEIGPHSALAGPFKQISIANKFENLKYIPTLVRGADSAVQLLKTVGELLTNGYDIDLEKVNSIGSGGNQFGGKHKRGPRILVDLPPYQWNYEKKYWAEPRFSHEQRNVKYLRHDLLGSRVVGLSDHSLVWKNQLRHRDVPWLKDHSLGNAAIFPAAGHMSMAIEALRQVSEEQGVHVQSVTLRDVLIQTALVIPESDNGIEVQLRFHRDSATTSSTGERVWYSFAVESITDNVWTIHCEGRIAANILSSQIPASSKSPVQSSKLHQKVPGKRWYDAFHRVGFQYTGVFQPLGLVRSNGKDRHAASTVVAKTTSGSMLDESRYVLHPATIDACLQLIIISINSGLHKEMPWGVVPLQMEEVSLWLPGGDADLESQAVAWTTSQEGRYFDTHTFLQGKSGNLLLDVKNLRCVAYEAAVPPNLEDSRNPEPYMQVAWKPDCTRLGAKGSSEAVSSPVTYLASLVHHKSPLKSVLVLGEPSLDLVQGLKDSVPGARIVLGTAQPDTLSIFEAAAADGSLSLVKLQEDVSSWAETISELHDLVVVDTLASQALLNAEAASAVKEVLIEGGYLIETTPSDHTSSISQKLGVLGSGQTRHTLTLQDKTVALFFLRPYQNGKSHDDDSIKFVSTDPSSAKLKGLLQVLGERDSSVGNAAFADFVAPSAGKLVIHDTNGELLASLDETTFAVLKQVLSAGRPILWVTYGVNQGTSIPGAMAQGFLRAIRSEQAAAKIALLDVDGDESFSSTATSILDVLDSVGTKDSGVDTEFWLHEGALHIPRIVPNDDLNPDLTKDAENQKSVLSEQARLDGTFQDGEVHFRAADLSETNLGPSELEIRTKTFGIRDPKHPADQGQGFVIGEVTSVGENVSEIKVGQTVATYSSKYFSTRVRIASSSAVSIGDIDEKRLTATLGPLGAVVNGFIVHGKTGRGDHALLLPSPTALVRAAVGISSIVGFELTIVAENAAKKSQLIEILGIPATNVYSADDINGIHSIFTSPTKTTPQVVFGTEFAALAQEVWRLLPRGGKFILNDGPISQAPDIGPFSRGASFIPTGLDTSYKQSPQSLGKVLETTLELIKENSQLLVSDPVIYDVGELGQSSVKPASQPVEYSVGIFGYGTSQVKIESTKDAFTLPPDAAYILVGCLGGLGRSLTAFMRNRGCQNFVFISRSGTKNPEAARLVGELKESGASVSVYNGDASREADVTRIISEVKKTNTIRGVIHAAMVLNDGMFEGLTFDNFTAAIKPKVLGAINLHNALQGTPLDFFIMTSSISAVLGNPGQTNYSAANSYLDSLAWYRNKHGLPATSLALPMVLDVGVVAENENIELSLSRKGMYGIDENEMISAFEAAMSLPVPVVGTANRGASHLVLGLDPTLLAAALSSEDTVDPYWYNDARLSGIRGTVESVLKSSTSSSKAGGDFASQLKSIASEGTDAILQAISLHIMQKCSTILMLSVEDFEFDGKSIASYGLDSMIGAELRNWLFKEFELDIGFQTLLTPTQTFKTLSITVGEKLGVL